MAWRSLLGIVAIVGIAWALSENRRRFPWRAVLAGLCLQGALAAFILGSSWGRSLFEGVQSLVLQLLDFAKEGGIVVFGALADPEKMGAAFGPADGFVLAITVTTTITMVAALSATLYHWGILQRIVQLFAVVMRRLMDVSGAESLASAANIFMGQTEAPVIVKPYIPSMTRSEILSVMTGGMATIAGSMLVVYVSFDVAGGSLAGHLLTASVLSAPGALMMAKIIAPETETPRTATGAAIAVERESVNAIDAACRGASDGIRLSLNVIGALIAFVGLVALANAILGFTIERVSGWFGNPVREGEALQLVMAALNYPFAWLIGIPTQDLWTVSGALGERVVLNELFGYLTIVDARDSMDPRSFTLASYALCGFANFGSIAIQIGGISALAPERRPDLARLGAKAMVAGLLTCYLTAALVGLWI